MDTISVGGHEFAGFQMKTQNSCILIIKAKHGFLGCGYISLPAANKLLDDVAIVTGVSNYEEMLEAEVVACSDSAAAIGVKKGITGLEALIRMN